MSLLIKIGATLELRSRVLTNMATCPIDLYMVDKCPFPGRQCAFTCFHCFFIERSIEKSLTFHSKKEGENLKRAFLLKIASELIIRYEKRVVTHTN